MLDEGEGAIIGLDHRVQVAFLFTFHNKGHELLDHIRVHVTAVVPRQQHLRAAINQTT
jgi:hypothetical protein